MNIVQLVTLMTARGFTDLAIKRLTGLTTQGLRAIRDCEPTA